MDRSAAGADAGNTPAGSGADRALVRRVLLVLMLVGALNHFDRHILAILMPRIRADMNLSDFELGVLSGVAFGAVYAIMGIPVALLAARTNRRNIIAVALAVWSSLTILCGFAQNFWHLALARLGVGIGEAGGTAPSHSIISDYVPEGRRGAAMAFFSAGANLGLFLAMIVGGTVAAVLDWRWAFIVAGVPGLIMLLVLLRTVPEPMREAGKQAGPPTRHLALLLQTFRGLWADRCLRHVIIGATLNATVVYGVIAWLPSYLVRNHQMELAAIGITLAVVLGLIGAVGTFGGGVLADRMARRNLRWYAWVIAAAIVVGKPFMFIVLLTDLTPLALGLLIMATIFGAVFLGPTISLLHDRSAPAMRPVASAVLLFIVNLVGLGLGPLIVGTLSDLVFEGGDSLRYAMVSAQLLGIWAAVHYWRAGIAMSGRLTPT